VRIIAGQWGGRRIAAPAGRHTRPTSDRVREAWMSAAQPDLPGARVLDLFAGSGALGLEALSRGAASVTFVERAAPALRALRDNVERLGAGDAVTVVREDALRYAETLGAGAFDVAFADPPYGQGLASAIARVYARVPFAAVLWIEHRATEPLPAWGDARSRRYGDTVLTCMWRSP
jgi:16S rRNA (guanine966-N2)-methyltransferase